MALITIPLRNGGEMLADSEDEWLLAPIPWMRLRVGRDRKIEYAYSGWFETRVYAHRLVLAAVTGVEVDHINGDGLDNRRSNLRAATHALNLANQRPQQGRSSRFKGVSWNKQRRGWEAYIRVAGRQIHLGLFSDEGDAALAYDKAAIAAWGSFARPNLLEAG